MAKARPRWMEANEGTGDDRFSRAILDQVELIAEIFNLAEQRRDELLPYTRGILDRGDWSEAAGPLLYEANRLVSKKLALIENMHRAQKRREVAVEKVDPHYRLHHLIDTERMFEGDAHVAAGIAIGIMMVKEHALSAVNVMDVFKSAGEKTISDRIALFADLQANPKVAAA